MADEVRVRVQFVGLSELLKQDQGSGRDLVHDLLVAMAAELLLVAGKIRRTSGHDE
jgi:hypothetical protein